MLPLSDFAWFNSSEPLLKSVCAQLSRRRAFSDSMLQLCRLCYAAHSLLWQCCAEAIRM